ncbi:MAG: CrcB-like protein-domain-containing protein [Piptocephalis tieghemiana]|nr:MAG: CrcB-like protein-domain-containing protein [Piptocephalis tieghemiana]
MGTLVRMGIIAMNSYPGTPVSPLFHAQFFGSCLMGLFQAYKDDLGGTSALYITLTTGLCGSITTFSTWQWQIWRDYSNYPIFPYRTLWQDILAGLTEMTWAIFSVSSAYLLGAWLGRLSRAWLRQTHGPIRSLIRTRTGLHTTDLRIGHSTWVNVTLLLLGLISTVVLLVISICVVSHRSYTMAACLATPGTLIRWYLSRWNRILSHFPVGTFTVNVFGAWIYGGVWLAARSRHPWTSPNLCIFLQALLDGFCGCLTTVSTLISEVHLLTGCQATRYLGASIISSQVFLASVVGTLHWSHALPSDGGCPS